MIGKFFKCKEQDPFATLTNAVVNALCSDPILNKIQNLQRTLDTLDIEGLHMLLSNKSTAHEEYILPCEPSIEEWSSFVNQYLSSISQADKQSAQRDTRYTVLSYLLSNTFKDCSLIIKFFEDGTGASLHVIDLDPKSISKLDKWFDLDQRIIKAFKEQSTTCRDCIDDNS